MPVNITIQNLNDNQSKNNILEYDIDIARYPELNFGRYHNSMKSVISYVSFLLPKVTFKIQSVAYGG